MGRRMTGGRTALLVRLMIAALVLNGSLMLSVQAGAVEQDPPRAWNWAETTVIWNEYGISVAPTLMPDPLGQRQGPGLLVEFSAWGWEFFCSNGTGLYHFEHGKDYTLLFDVYGCGGYLCETDVRIVTAPSRPVVDVHDASGDVLFVSDQTWQTLPVYVEDFRGPTGDYYLWLHDQAGKGCWMIGDIRQTGGLGHK